MIEFGDGWEMRSGKWQSVFNGLLSVDAVVCDPPYGARIHESKPTRSDAFEHRGSGYDPDGLTPKYKAWTPDDVAEFVEWWSPRCRGWMVALTSHDLIPAWEEYLGESGRYVFHPIPCVMRGMSVRLCGDGPSSWAVFAIVARPSTPEFARWGTLPGAYTGPSGTETGGGRGKPMWLMSALIRDYTRPGDLVCDPFAGWGSTLSAAVVNCRKAIGAEQDGDAFAEAVRRLSRPAQVDLFGGAA